MAQVPYNAEGVTVAPQVGSPDDYQHMQASPNAFGAQVGGAVEKLGATTGDLANHYGGMIMETMSANAESAYSQKLSDVTGKFKQLEGNAAALALPQYQADVTALRQQYRDDLPMAAAHSFDQLALRHESYALSDGSNYVATQIKQGNIKANSALVDNSINAMGNYDVASDDERAGFQIGTIKHATTMQMQTQGWESVMTQNPKTGEVGFIDTPDGNKAKAIYEDTLNKNLGEAQYNRYQALASQNVPEAYKKYQENRSDVPPETQVKLDAYFKPKIREYAVDGYINDLQAQISVDHRAAITNQSNPIDFVMKHEGGFVTNDGGKGATNFGINSEANPDVDVKGLTQDQAKQIIQTRYADKIGADKMSPALAAVAIDGAVNQGVGKTQQLLAQAGGDPQKLIDLRRAEYNRLATENPERYGKYLPAWNSRLNDLQASLKNQPDPTSGSQSSFA